MLTVAYVFLSRFAASLIFCATRKSWLPMVMARVRSGCPPLGGPEENTGWPAVLPPSRAICHDDALLEGVW